MLICYIKKIIQYKVLCFGNDSLGNTTFLYDSVPINLNKREFHLDIIYSPDINDLSNIIPDIMDSIRAIIIYFDLLNSSSMEKMQKYIQSIHQYLPYIPIFINCISSDLKCFFSKTDISQLLSNQKINIKHIFYTSKDNPKLIDEMLTNVALYIDKPIFYQFLCLGEKSAGKTSFIKRLIENDFSDEIPSTQYIENNFMIVNRSEYKIFLNLIDSPSINKVDFNSFSHENVDAIILFLDSSTQQSIYIIENALIKIQNYFSKCIPIYINLTKYDLPHFRNSDESMYVIYKYNHPFPFFTSSKQNVGLNEMFLYIIGYISYKNEHDSIIRTWNNPYNEKEIHYYLTKNSIYLYYFKLFLKTLQSSENSAPNTEKQNTYDIPSIYRILYQFDQEILHIN